MLYISSLVSLSPALPSLFSLGHRPAIAPPLPSLHLLFIARLPISHQTHSCGVGVRPCSTRRSCISSSATASAAHCSAASARSARSSSVTQCQFSSPSCSIILAYAPLLIVEAVSSHKSRLRANQKARQPVEKPQRRQNKQPGVDITYPLINNSIDPRQPKVGLGGSFETKLGRAADGDHGSLALRERVGGAACAEGARAKDLFDERVEAGDAGADEDAGAFDAVV